MRHKNKYVNDSFKRNIVYIYKSCSKIDEELSRTWELFTSNLFFKQSMKATQFIMLQTIIHLQYRHHLIHLVSAHLRKIMEWLEGTRNISKKNIRET